MKVQAIYKNKILKKTLEFASDNGTLFIGTTSLLLSTVARPISILATPNTNKENKKYIVSKSLASSAAGYFLMLITSLPLANSIKKINENPSKYLKRETIETLKANEKVLTKSKKYNFATQLFKLGLGFVIAVPKSIMTCALIPSFMENLFNKKSSKKNKITFTGTTDNIAKSIGRIIDKQSFRNFTEKFYKTNFPQHIMSLTDTVATGTFILQTSKSKKIDEDRKKILIYNSRISTGLCILGGYVINHFTKKPTEKFIKQFKETNKNSPKLEKYIDGIKIVKPALILGTLYYIFIPMISTFLADKGEKMSKQK